jgi:hypothetical protein
MLQVVCLTGAAGRSAMVGDEDPENTPGLSPGSSLSAASRP